MSGSQQIVSSSVLNAELFSSSNITVIVLQPLEANLPQLLSQYDGDTPDIGNFFASAGLLRELLFFDEVVKTHVILTCPALDVNTLESHLTRLIVSLDLRAIWRSPANRNDGKPQPASPDEIIVTHDLNGKEDARPQIIYSHPKLNGSVLERSYIVWENFIHLNRSRLKSADASVYFSVTATLMPAEPVDATANADDYLPSGVPTSPNLLEAFQSDPQFRKNPPKLFASMLTKIPTPNATREKRQSLRNIFQHLYRLAAAVNSRVRFHPIGFSPTQTKVLACVDIEVPATTIEKVILECVELVLSDGRAEQMTGPKMSSFPMKCNPGSQVSIIYNLVPYQYPSANVIDGAAHTITFTGTARVITGGIKAETGGIHLKLHWRTDVDLSSLRRSSLFKVVERPATAEHNDESTSSTRSRSVKSTKSTNHLITLTVSGPPTVRVHSVLQWSLLLANHSKTRTLNLTITAITYAVSFSSTTASHSMSSSHEHDRTISDTAAMDDDSADSVDMPLATAGLIPLTPDLHVPGLSPGASTTAEMRFLVLRTGVLRLPALRIVDLDEKEGKDGRVDVGAHMLPDIVAVERDDVGEGDDASTG